MLRYSPRKFSGRKRAENRMICRYQGEKFYYNFQTEFLINTVPPNSICPSRSERREETEGINTSSRSPLSLLRHGSIHSPNTDQEPCWAKLLCHVSTSRMTKFKLLESTALTDETNAIAIAFKDVANGKLGGVMYCMCGRLAWRYE